MRQATRDALADAPPAARHQRNPSLEPLLTPEGLPLAYEVLPGNTSDKTTLKGFLERIGS
ncbi:MAG TPA: hypothetical protein VFG64_07755 [Dongiaceae bacterium]|nr:hypothetical protein [Dongiaceae bacterium]